MDIYYDVLPVFVPFNLLNIFPIESYVDVYCDCYSLEEYYYKISNSDFFLLDLSLVKFFDVNFRILRRVFEFGRIKGDLYFVEKTEIEKLDILLKKDYNRAFIFILDDQKRKFSTIIYFVINKQKIMQILNG